MNATLLEMYQPEQLNPFRRCIIQRINMADIKSNRKSIANAKNYFREYCDYTGIHGFKFIGERRSLCEK